MYIVTSSTSWAKNTIDSRYLSNAEARLSKKLLNHALTVYYILTILNTCTRKIKKSKFQTPLLKSVQGQLPISEEL